MANAGYDNDFNIYLNADEAYSFCFVTFSHFAIDHLGYNLLIFSGFYDMYSSLYNMKQVYVRISTSRAVVYELGCNHV